MAGKVSAAGALNRGAAVMAAGGDDLTQKIMQLRRKSEDLRGHWQGNAAVIFTALMSRWTEDTNKIVNTLNRFEYNFKMVEGEYAKTEYEQQQAFGRIQGLLG